VIYGINPVTEGLTARTIDRIYVKEDVRSERLKKILREAKSLNVTIVTRKREVLDRMAGTSDHQGVVAVAAPLPLFSIEELIEAGGERPFFVILDGLEDPRNLGAALRTCAAAGADGVILPSRRTCGLTPVVHKASAGALHRLRLSKAVNVKGAMEKLKEAGFWVYGFASESDLEYTAVDYRDKIALLFGSEGKGLKPTVKKACDRIASIPMPGGIESLNISVTVGVVLYEALRQRRGV
jgi:23S rRNA (guanosine2251-2'-O)-methyltransferase